MIVELVGGPLDGTEVEVDDDHIVYRATVGGVRPVPRWTPGEGQPLVPATPRTTVTYRRHADEDKRSALFNQPIRFRFDERAGAEVRR